MSRRLRWLLGCLVRQFLEGLTQMGCFLTGCGPPQAAATPPATSDEERVWAELGELRTLLDLLSRNDPPGQGPAPGPNRRTR